MIKLILLAVLAVLMFVLGGFASLQLADMAGSLPILVRIAALGLGGLVFTWIVFVLGDRLLEMIYGATDDAGDKHAPKEEEERPAARKPAAPPPARKPG